MSGHWKLPVALVAAGLAFGTALGIVIAFDDDMPCTAGQVYVVDTDTCADATDHGAHEGHGS